MNHAVLRARKYWAIVALAGLPACGGGSPAAPPVPTPPPTTTLPPAILADLGATTTSSENGKRLNCRGDVHALVTVTNRALSSVLVSGILKQSHVVSGDCFPAPESTYRPIVRSLPPGVTIVMDRPLFQGSGCCTKGFACDGHLTCTFSENLTVLTELGPVAAGGFSYTVNFKNCAICSSLRAQGRDTCPPAASP